MSGETMAGGRERIPYGAWPSPITAEAVARGRRDLGFPTLVEGGAGSGPGRGLWWQERRPGEAGRTTVVHRSWDGDLREPLGASGHWDLRTRVHEYGGRSYLVLPDGGLVFVNHADQRVYRAGPAGRAHPISPEPDRPAGLRYAEPTLSPDATELWCVQERHSGDRVRRAIVALPLSGTAAGDPGAIRTLASGAGFYACPTVSPDGEWLAVVTWDHPRMPWDGTELCVARIRDDGEVSGLRPIMGGPDESVLAPIWRDEAGLYAISDASGWWNPYLVKVDGTAPEALCPSAEEFAEPPWQLGAAPHGVLGDGRLAVLHGRGDLRLAVLDPERGILEDLDLPFSTWAASLSVAGSEVAGVAAGPHIPWSLVRVDVETGRWEVVRRTIDDLPDRAYLPDPYTMTVRSGSGAPVSVHLYPPSGPHAAEAARSVDGERPPYLVWAHGGPTGYAGTEFDLAKAFFTSRGIGVADVNYTGSSGYGREHRNRLRGRWGLADAEDVVAVAKELTSGGVADPARLAIRGGSAGGWTTLAAVTSSQVFSAATSYFGVCSLREFRTQTHDFESHYVDGLIGSADPDVQIAREPLSHAGQVSCPVLLLQGLDDPVVPPGQSELIARVLDRKGLPYAYLAFEGESHGFRKEETIVACLEAELSFYAQAFGFDPPGIPRLALTSRANH